MKIIIVGDGKLGSRLAHDLTPDGHELTLIDTQSAVLQNTMNTYDIMGVVGNGASYDTLMEAGVKSCDILIAVTDSDEVNILSCVMAKKLGAKSTIARVRNTDYAKQLNMMQDELGINMVINPERETAQEITRNLRIPSALDVDLFARGKVELIELKLGAASPLVGLKLMDLPSRFKTRFLVCAVSRGDEVYIPDGRFQLKGGDHIHITASPQAIQDLLRSLGIVTQKVKNVMIVGGSRTAIYLTMQLLSIGMNVTIVEKDEKRCDVISELVPKATIISGDGTDPEVLHEEGLRSMDAFIALTGIDEQNIIISMYAGLNGSMKVFTKIDHIIFPEVIKILGDESIVSPTNTSATQIERFVRATQNSLGTNIETLHKLVGGRVEALEFNVQRRASYVGVPLKKLLTKPNTLIACINRAGTTIIPGGLDTIETGDRVVVVCAGVNIQDLKDIFL